MNMTLSVSQRLLHRLVSFLLMSIGMFSTVMETKAQPGIGTVTFSGPVVKKWQFSGHGGYAGKSDDWIYGITKDNTGCYVGAGFSALETPPHILYPSIQKFNADGDLLWQQRFTDTDPIRAGSFYDVTSTADGNFAAVGFRNIDITPNVGTIYFLKFDPNGNVLLDKKFGLHTDISRNETNVGFAGGAFSVREVTGGGFVIAGGTDQLQAFLLKLDANGVLDPSFGNGAIPGTQLFGITGTFAQSVRLSFSPGGVNDGFILTGYSPGATSGNGVDTLIRQMRM
jgi:hypothetical protein